MEAHLEQLKEMEALCHKEGMLLSQQHDMVRLNPNYNLKTH